MRFHCQNLNHQICVDPYKVRFYEVCGNIPPTFAIALQIRYVFKVICLGSVIIHIIIMNIFEQNILDYFLKRNKVANLKSLSLFKNESLELKCFVKSKIFLKKQTKVLCR